MKVGDVVEHKQFGRGVVLSVNEATGVGKAKFDEEEFEKIFNQEFLESINGEPVSYRSIKTRSSRLPRVAKYFTNNGNTELLDYLRVHGSLRVQLPPQSVSSFKYNYKRVTGEDIDVPSEHVSVITPTAKWGITTTVLFPSAYIPFVPSDLSPFIYSHTTPDVGAICRNDFFWELLTIGFRLGKQTTAQGA